MHTSNHEEEQRMTRSDTDLSAGLSAASESVLMSPPDIAEWAENLLFSLYDPNSDVGLWMHYGTVPSDWNLVEDWVLVFLPGDQGVLSMKSYARTPAEERPAGANLRFTCIEPFRRWRVQFDGFGLHSSLDEMKQGRVREGKRQRFKVDLDVQCITPVWDAHTASASRSGKGSMEDGQSWATEHYEQLYSATGSVHLESGEVAFDGTGWRDHSRGPRGAELFSSFGGHVIAGCVFPESGRAWGASRYWTPDGTINLEGGYLVDGKGVLEHVEVVEAPRLKELQMSGEPLEMVLRGSAGDSRFQFTTRRSLWMTMMEGSAVGADLSGPGMIYALNFGPCEWDGESGYVYIERSDRLNAWPELRAAT
jgi:hypothetical protein